MQHTKNNNLLSYCSCLNRCLKTTKTDSFCKTIFTSIWHVCGVLCIESGTVNSWKKSLILFYFFTILQQDNENENKETKMNRLYFIQVTFLLYSIACVDGQALYEDKCVTKDAKDVEQFKGNSLFIIHIL